MINEDTEYPNNELRRRETIVCEREREDEEFDVSTVAMDRRL
jgi:hypothetical protein